jgi:hypothetical protein
MLYGQIEPDLSFSIYRYSRVPARGSGEGEIEGPVTRVFSLDLLFPM